MSKGLKSMGSDSASLKENKIISIEPDTKNSEKVVAVRNGGAIIAI